MHSMYDHSLNVSATSSNTTALQGAQNGPTEGDLFRFFINFALLVVILGFCYFFLVVCMSRCDESLQQRVEAARDRFIKKSLLVREWKGVDDDHTSTELSSEFDPPDIESQQPRDEQQQEKQQQPQQPQQQVQQQIQQVQTASRRQSLKIQESVVSCTLSEDNNDLRSSCAICLAPFVIGERVCQSNNNTCWHIFHENCMLHWLQKHDECPVCRQVYLVDTV